MIHADKTEAISASIYLDASCFLRSLNIHSVRFAMSTGILEARRQLEHDPLLTFANHPRHTEPLRPPPPVDLP